MLKTQVTSLFDFLTQRLYIGVVLFGLFGSSISYSQTDSTDLALFMTDAVLETSLDSILYSGDTFEQLNLDFTITDTLSFHKVHVELKNTTADHTVFKKQYALTDLETESLISDWAVSIPFGNLENTNAYEVSIIIENYDGSLGTSITKTLLP